MFLGEFEHTLDPKGRLAIPAKFREELAEGLVLTRGYDRCLQVFPTGRWGELAERASALSLANPDARTIRRLLFAGASDVRLDPQGRILIPQNLRDYAELREQVVIAGLNTHFEIWSAERWRQVIDQLDDNASAIAQQLAQLGL